MRSSQDSLLRQLEQRGYTISTFSVESVGSYAIEDADWNYKDVPHVNIVHTQVRTIIATMDDDVICTINLQKILGIPFPVALVNYATSETSQTYFTTMGPYALVVYTEYFAIEKNRTRVVTTYNIAAKGWPRLAFPLLRRIIQKNYRVLMSEDLPMRDRRGELRERGLHFASDGRSRTFPETTQLMVDNVVVPPRQGSSEVAIQISDLPADGSALTVGTNDDRGLALVREGDSVLALPRMCPHEGASLDCATVKQGKLTCPWHARLIKPLATVTLSEGNSATFGAYAARVEQGQLFVRLPQ